MKNIIIFFCVLFVLKSNAQINEGIEEKPISEFNTPKRKIPTKTQIKMLDTFLFKADELDARPTFKGSFLKFLEQNLKYPESASNTNEQGKVVIDFVVDKKGNLSKIKLSNETETKNEALVKEALRIIKLTTVGKWNAGKIYGKSVKSTYSQSIHFVLAEEEEAPPPPPPIKTNKSFDDDVANGTFHRIETEAEYKGSFKKFIEDNLKYPAKAERKKIEGIVIIQFLIDREGKVSDISVADYSPQKNDLLVAEAISVIKLTSGNWKAGTQNGRAVRSYHSQSIAFALK